MTPAPLWYTVPPKQAKIVLKSVSYLDFATKKKPQFMPSSMTLFTRTEQYTDIAFWTPYGSRLRKLKNDRDIATF